MPFIGIVTTATLPDIRIYTDQGFSDVTVTIDRSPVLSERYYTDSDHIVITDWGRIVEEYMRHRSLVTAQVAVTAATGPEGVVDDEVVMSVLYCDRMPDDETMVDTWLNHNFISPVSVKRISPDAVDRLYFYSEDEITEATLYVTMRYQGEVHRHGPEVVSIYPEDVANNIYAMIVSMREYLSDYCSRYDFDDSALLSLTISIGYRSMTYFVDGSLRTAPSFVFRNCFGLQEYFAFSAKTTETTAVEQSLARLSMRSVHYDRSTSVEYALESAPLTDDELLLASQLVTSYDIRLANGSETDWELLLPILVTDSTCEFADAPDASNRLKLTWRYRDNRPPMAFPSPSRSFSDQFNSVYK